MNEGVIKFTADHDYRELSADLVPLSHKLDHWRHVLKQHGLVGQTPDRYNGFGFGNLSGLIEHTAQSKADSPAFLITGTQTGNHERLQFEHFSEVIGFDLAQNSVKSQGAARPSSEALTHAAVYALGSAVRFVFHAHSPQIWHAAAALDLPVTERSAEYGTVAMAMAIKQSCAEQIDRRGDRPGLIVMGGHEDGVISFGAAIDDVGNILLDTITRSKAFQR